MEEDTEGETAQGSMPQTGQGPAQPLASDLMDYAGGGQESMPQTGQGPIQPLPSNLMEDRTGEGGQPSTQETYYSDQAEGEYGQPSTQEAYYGGPAEGSTAMAPKEASTQSSGTWIEVSVERIRHTLRRDEYVFTDAKNRRQSTDREHWERTKYSGKTVWAFHGKKLTYFSRDRIA